MGRAKNKEQIHLWIDKNTIELSDKLRQYVLENDGLVFFKLHTESNNQWYKWLIQMGLVKAKEEFEKFRKNLENEIQDQNTTEN